MTPELQIPAGYEVIEKGFGRGQRSAPPAVTLNMSGQIRFNVKAASVFRDRCVQRLNILLDRDLGLIGFAECKPEDDRGLKLGFSPKYQAVITCRRLMDEVGLKAKSLRITLSEDGDMLVGKLKEAA